MAGRRTRTSALRVVVCLAAIAVALWVQDVAFGQSWRASLVVLVVSLGLVAVLSRLGWLSGEFPARGQRVCRHEGCRARAKTDYMYCDEHVVRSGQGRAAV